MCGFAGVVAWDDRFRVTRDTLARMSARIAHRGPDGEGMFLNHESEITPARPQVALAHRRLAILDPDPRANQPFADALGRQLVFNGEIYNFRDLRSQLSRLRPDYRWRTDCDTEALLIAYDVWGEQCVDHFNGMFAFALWDEPRQSLFLARDRMGQKPLYVAYQSPALAGSPFEGSSPIYRGKHSAATVVAFASELSALLELPWVNRTVSTESLMEYLRWGWSEPIYRGVSQLRPGHSAWFSTDSTLVRWYFTPNLGGLMGAKPATYDDSDAVAHTRNLVTASVRRQLVSDVPLGCFLSGGMDSSVVAAAMRRAVPEGQRVLTFSVGFDDPRYDESQYAQRVADHLGTDHRTFTVRPHAAEDLPKIAAAFGGPFGDSSALPTYYLARATRPFVKVALSGDGGDELFGGYDRYRAMRWGRRLRGLLGRGVLRRLPAVARHLLPGVHPKSRSSRFRRFLDTLALPTDLRYASYLRLFDQPLMFDLFQPNAVHCKWFRVDDLSFQFSRQEPMSDEVRAALATDRVTYLPGDLLTKVDRCSMQFALEVRSPFMDHELVHFAANLTTDQLLRGGGKRMLREAFAADLPAEVFTRRKMGFAVPIGDWLRGELRPMLHDHLFAADSFAAGHFNKATLEKLVEQHERRTVDHSQRLYALLMLELWWSNMRT